MSALVCSGTGSIWLFEYTVFCCPNEYSVNPIFTRDGNVLQKALWGVFASPVRQNRPAASANPPQTYTKARSPEFVNFGLNELRLHTDYLLPLCILAMSV